VTTSVTPIKLSAKKQEIKVVMKGARESTILSQNKKRPLKDIADHTPDVDTKNKKMKTLDSFFSRKTEPKKAVDKKAVQILKDK
jgi:hypothetical protein